MFDGYAARTDTRPVVDWFESGGTLELSDTTPAAELLGAVDAIDGLDRVAAALGAPRARRRAAARRRSPTSCSKASARSRRSAAPTKASCSARRRQTRGRERQRPRRRSSQS